MGDRCCNSKTKKTKNTKKQMTSECLLLLATGVGSSHVKKGGVPTQKKEVPNIGSHSNALIV